MLINSKWENLMSKLGIVFFYISLSMQVNGMVEGWLGFGLLGVFFYLIGD